MSIKNSPITGMVVGTGVQSGTSALVRAFTSWDRWADWAGIGAAVLIGGLLYSSSKTRGLGTLVIASGVISGLPRGIEMLVTGGAGLQGTYVSSGIQGIGAPANVQVLSGVTQAEEFGANTGTAFGALPIAGVN